MRAFTVLTLCGLAFFPIGCADGKDSCPDRSDMPCEKADYYDCDDCGQGWYCDYNQVAETNPTWGKTDWSCECINDDGTLNERFETGDTSAPRECQRSE